MSLLPQQILPPGEPIGTVTQDGTVTIDTNWWLLFYNLCLQVLGSGQGLPADALIDLESVDMDAIDADAIALRQPLSNALLLAHEALLPDPPARAQPIAAITVTASPFTYTAPFPGSVAISGGRISNITLIRAGASVTVAATSVPNGGITSGLFPVSRFDQLRVTYTAAPTMTFIPGSPA